MSFKTWRDKRTLWVRCCVAMLCGLLAAEGVAQPAQADPIAKHRRTLLGPDPAPIGHRSRQVAMYTLVRLDDPRAHAVLREVLAAFGEPSKAPAATIHKLLELLTAEQAVDLESLSRADPAKDKRLQKRLAVYRGYVASLVAIDAAAEAKVQDPAVRQRVHDDVKQFFKQLPAEFRRPDLKAIISDPKSELRAAAVRVAGRTEDPQIAVDIAPLLSDPSMRDAAREALASLTWRARPFVDRQDFDAWWKTHDGLSYEELTLAAARDAQTLGSSLAARYEREREQLLAKLARNVELVITLGLTQKPPPWKLFRSELAAPELSGHRKQLLEAFYKGLRGTRIDAKTVQQSAADLGALRAFFESEYGKAARDERGGLLAGLTVVSVLLGGESKAKIETELLGLLERPSVAAGDVAESRVLDLLSMFREDRVRERVLAALEARPSMDTRAGLACLEALGLSDQDALVTRTLGFLNGRVRDAKLGGEEREFALKILGKMGVDRPKVLDSLRAIAVGPQAGKLPENLRVTALQLAILQGESQLQSRKNGDLEKQARDQLRFLHDCLTDRSPRIRRGAATALVQYPPSSASFARDFLHGLGQTIVAKAGRSLQTETDPGCIRLLRSILVAQADRANLAQEALTRLVDAMVRWAGTGKVINRDRDDLAKDLARLLKGQIDAVTTLELARRLVDAELFDAGRILLTSPKLAELDTKRAGSDTTAGKEWQKQRRDRAELCLRVVVGAGDLDKLPVAERRELYHLLVTTFHGLQEVADKQPTLLVALGLALLDAKRHADAVTVLDGFLRRFGKDAETGLARRARIGLARAKIDAGKPLEAAVVLDGQPDVDSRVLRADALQRGKNYAAAEKVLAGLAQDPELTRRGTLRERVVVDLAWALLKQRKLAELDKHLDSLPELTDKTAKDKLTVLRAQLAEARRKSGAAKKTTTQGRAAKPGKQ